MLLYYKLLTSISRKFSLNAAPARAHMCVCVMWWKSNTASTLYLTRTHVHDAHYDYSVCSVINWRCCLSVRNFTFHNCCERDEIWMMCSWTLYASLHKCNSLICITVHTRYIYVHLCERCLFNIIGLHIVMFVGMTHAQLKGDQEDPCKSKSRVVGDATYCDRYWECVNGQPELYDCPNGLVFAGKHRGVTDGCDYPWRSNYCEGKQQASTYTYMYLCIR